MFKFDQVEIEILNHLYKVWEIGLNDGWENASFFDKKVIDTLSCACFIDTNPSQQGLIRISTRGVGTLMFGPGQSWKIQDLL